MQWVIRQTSLRSAALTHLVAHMGIASELVGGSIRRSGSASSVNLRGSETLHTSPSHKCLIYC